MGSSCFGGLCVPSSVRYRQELLRTSICHHLSSHRIRLNDSFETTIPYSAPAILSVCLSYWSPPVSYYSFSAFSNSIFPTTDKARQTRLHTHTHLPPFLSHSCWVRELYTLFAISFLGPLPYRMMPWCIMPLRRLFCCPLFVA